MGLFGSSSSGLSKSERKELGNIRRDVKRQQALARHFKSTGNDTEARPAVSSVERMQPRLKFLKAKNDGSVW